MVALRDGHDGRPSCRMGLGQAVSPPAYGYLAWTFGALTAAYALYSWLSKRQSMQWAVAIGVTLTTITANQALGLDLNALAVEFLALAVGKAIVARVYRGTRMHTFLYVAAGLQAVIAAAIPVDPDWLRTVILITAGVMSTFMAVDGKRPEWLYLAGAFFTYGWYWLLKIVIPPPPNPGPSTLELIFSPLPVATSPPRSCCSVPARCFAGAPLFTRGPLRSLSRSAISASRRANARS